VNIDPRRPIVALPLSQLSNQEQGSSHETMFAMGRNTPETMRLLNCHQQYGGVMDIVVAFLTLVSVGVFAAHFLDALRAG